METLLLREMSSVLVPARVLRCVDPVHCRSANVLKHRAADHHQAALWVDTGSTNDVSTSLPCFVGKRGK